MGVDYSTHIYLPNYSMWARPVTFHPLRSQPGVPTYDARGIFGTVSVDIVSADTAVVSEQRTILDILEIEFDVLPRQQDRVYIGPDPTGMKRDEGMWEVNDVSTNGGGEATLELRRIVTAEP